MKKCLLLNSFFLIFLLLFLIFFLKVKPKLLDLIENYYLPLKMNLIPCIPGLVVSILPGLEENNEEIQKKVLHTLDMQLKELVENI